MSEQSRNKSESKIKSNRSKSLGLPPSPKPLSLEDIPEFELLSLSATPALPETPTSRVASISSNSPEIQETPPGKINGVLNMLQGLTMRNSSLRTPTVKSKEIKAPSSITKPKKPVPDVSNQEALVRPLLSVPPAVTPDLPRPPQPIVPATVTYSSLERVLTAGDPVVPVTRVSRKRMSELSLNPVPKYPRLEPQEIAEHKFKTGKRKGDQNKGTKNNNLKSTNTNFFMTPNPLHPLNENKRVNSTDVILKKKSKASQSEARPRAKT